MPCQKKEKSVDSFLPTLLVREKDETYFNTIIFLVSVKEPA
jgi:hypothetical protein